MHLKSADIYKKKMDKKHCLMIAYLENDGMKFVKWIIL